MKYTKSSRLLVVVLGVALAGGLGTWHASLRASTGPAAGVGIQGSPVRGTSAEPTLRFGTLNIASGQGLDGKCDLDRTAGALTAQPLDFVALQEVRGSLWPEADNQAATLGRRLDLGWLYAPAETRWYCRQFGNGLLSRLRVRSWQRIPLPCDHDRSRRNVVFLVLEGPGRPIHVLATHLTQRDPRDRETQLQAVIGLFLAMQEPAILLGDLNSTPEDPAIRALLARPGVDDPVGRLIRPSPKGRVDWILLRGLKAVAAGFRDGPFSDHPLYTVDVAWGGPEEKKPSPPSPPATSVKREVE